MWSNLTSFRLRVRIVNPCFRVYISRHVVASRGEGELTVCGLAIYLASFRPSVWLAIPCSRIYISRHVVSRLACRAQLHADTSSASRSEGELTSAGRPYISCPSDSVFFSSRVSFYLLPRSLASFRLHVRMVTQEGRTKIHYVQQRKTWYDLLMIWT